MTAMAQTAGRSMSDDEKYERVLQKAGSKSYGSVSEKEKRFRVYKEAPGFRPGHRDGYLPGCYLRVAGYMFGTLPDLDVLLLSAPSLAPLAASST